MRPDRAPPSPRRRRPAMSTPASLTPGTGRRAPPQHRAASALAAAAPPGGGCCSGAPARELPRSSSGGGGRRRRRTLRRRSWRPRSSRQTWFRLGKYLRKISRRLRKQDRSVVVIGKAASPSSSSMAAAATVVDDTARERAESVARAISYCNHTLRRRRRPIPPPPPPSPSTSLADCDDDDCSRASRQSPTTRPRRGRDAASWPLAVGVQTTRPKRFNLPSRRDGSVAASTAAVAHGEESESSPRHGHGCHDESMSSSSRDGVSENI